MKEGLDILLPKVYIELFCVASCILQLARCIDRLSKFARKYEDQPTLGFTHFQYVLERDRSDPYNYFATQASTINNGGEESMHVD